MPSSVSMSLPKFITTVMAHACLIITVSLSAVIVSTQRGVSELEEIAFLCCVSPVAFYLSLFKHVCLPPYIAAVTVSLSPPSSSCPASSCFHCGLIRCIYFTAWLPVCTNGAKFLTPEPTPAPPACRKQCCWGQRAAVNKYESKINRDKHFLELFPVLYSSNAMLRYAVLRTSQQQKFWGCLPVRFRSARALSFKYFT